MEKLQLVPLMKVVKKTRTVKMVLLDAVLMEELGPRDQISRVASNVLRRYTQYPIIRNGLIRNASEI